MKSHALLGALSLLALTLPIFAADTQPPTIVSVSPAPGTTVSSLSGIVVTFSEPVVGEKAADLIINNEFPAVDISSSGAAVTFEFSQPAPGIVLVSFDPDAVITDQAGNPFDPLAPAAAWSYILADTVAPAVSASTPVAGATVQVLTQVEVRFSEAVTGVDVSDFQINGEAATGLVAIASERYLFQFPQPASGPVNITWTAGHGIRDLSPAANPFAGAGWSYVLNPAAPADLVINEILADNLNSVEDEDSQKHDWIELYNRGSGAVSLLGWSLTDDAADPGKWTFPNIALGAGQYLVVFASGKDRKTTAANATNHTNFRLDLAGGYLGLYGPESPRVAVSEVLDQNGMVGYPEQRGNISYGRTSSGANTYAYFSTLTPRGSNSTATAVSGFVQKPRATINSGLFNQPFNVYLSTETAGAEIYYTLNGSPPTTLSTPYTGPLLIAGISNKAVVTLRATAFKPGLLPSLVMTHTYIFPEQVLTQPTNPPGFPMIWDSPCTHSLNCFDINPADYEMDPQVLTNTANNYRALALQGLSSIPTVSIVTDVNLLFGAAEGVYVRREPFLRKPVSAEFLPADGSEGFQIDCGLEMQGQTSPDDSTTGGSKWKSLKLGLRLFFQGEFGATKLNYKVFEDSPVDSFDTLLLAAGHNNYWNYNNNDTQRTRSLYVRDQFVSDLQNLAGGRSHHGRFVHVYLNGLYWGLYFIHERPDEAFQASYYGGEKEDYDVFKHDASDVVNGNTASYTAMWGIINAGLANSANYELLQQYLDVPGLIDYLLINFWANNTDWDHKNLYASRHRQGGLWRFHAWDSEHTFADSDFALLDDNNGTNPTAIFRRLLANADFRVLLADRIHRLMFNGGILYTDPANPVFSPAFPERNRPAALFMKMLQDIDTAIVCESARWGDVGPGRESNPHTRNISFYEERDVVMGYRPTFGTHSSFSFASRGTNLLNQFRTRGWYPTVVAPVFSQHGGAVPAGFNLTITAPAGTIYYTTNGADPRVYGSGAVSPHAVQHNGGSITLGGTTVVKARALLGTNWSALNEATFLIAQLIAPVRVTEIMYNPVGGDAHEFIELQNVGTTDLDLSGYYFEGITFTFPPGSILAPGARIVLAAGDNPAAFAAQYPGVSVFGYYDAQLSNGGERLALKTPAPEDKVVLSVDYDDVNPWPTAPDGRGPSLEIIDVNGDPDDPANWRASTSANGTAGAVNSGAPPQAMRLNELVAAGGGDWVELHNQTAGAVDITGWSITDDGNARKFVFPSTSVPANGYLLVYCDTNSVPPGLHTGFGLDQDADSVFLYDANTNRVDAISFGMQLGGYSVGRTASGWELMSPTPVAANSAPSSLAAHSNLTINEWLANAPPSGSDWLELYNESTTLPAALGGLYIGTTDALIQFRALSFVAPTGFVQLLADEIPGPKHLDFKLEAGGDSIILYDSAALELERVTYGPQAENVSQGRFPDGSSTIVSFPGTASPGASNYVASYTGPYLNEVLARNQSVLRSPWGNYADWIEIHNPNPTSYPLGGMSLSDSPDDPYKWTFPFGATIAANSYIIIWCDSSHPPTTTGNANLNTGFNLSGESGGVYLFSNIGQTLDSVEYGHQVPNLSIGRAGAQWTLLTTPTPAAVNSAAATLGSANTLRINEWMADAPDADDWFELYNPSAQPVSLTGLYLTDDLSIPGQTRFRVGPLSFIGANGFAVFNADGNPGNGRHHVNFNLNAAGEAIRISSSTLAIIDTVYFGAHPTGVSEGRLPDGQAAIVRFGTTATPDASNYLPIPTAAVNELLSHSDPPLEDAVEIRNLTSQTVDISGWYLSDNTSNLRKYRIQPATTVGANQFHVFSETQLNGGVGSLVPFTFDSVRGDTVILSEADASDNLTGYRSQFSFGAARNGVTFGRFVTSIGEEFVAQENRTLDAGNSPPQIGPVVINEIMYHPQPLTGTNENSNDEYIELYNLTTNTATLYDPAHPTNTWRIRGGVEFDFPGGITLGSRSYLLLVNFNPADVAARNAFRSRFGIPTSVPLYGPYDGRLDNAGESIELYCPDTPQGPGPDAGFVPYVLVERVAYNDTPPWPIEPDGTGPSLQRRRPYQFGNEPLNWKSAIATPGRANVDNDSYGDADGDGLSDLWEEEHDFQSANASDADMDADGDGLTNYQEYLDGTDPRNGSSAIDAPAILAQPSDQTVLRGSNAMFSVTASGQPLKYQWRHNGSNLSQQTNSTLLLTSVQPSQAGDYSVVVFNVAGLEVSRNAHLTVNLPPRITQQPQNARTNVGNSVTFTVTAVGTGTLRYQWYKDGNPINNATNAALTLTNLQLEDSGDYHVRVTDDVAFVDSDVAILLVLQRPVLIQHPVGMTVAVGDTANFTAIGRGTLPITHRWRRLGTFILNLTTNSYTSTFSIPNVQTNHADLYTIVMTNIVGGSALSSNAQLVVVIPPTNQTVEAGADVTFQAKAVGRPGIRYQWEFNSTPLTGETNAMLVLTNVQPAQAGSYAVVVAPFTNTVVLPNTFFATLTVEAPARLIQPQLLPDGSFRMVLEGRTGTNYMIEFSTNLTSWSDLNTINATGTQTPYTDTTNTNAPQRFYRARVAP